MEYTDEIQHYINALTNRAKQLQALHSKQVDDRERISIATRSCTLGKLRATRQIMAELQDSLRNKIVKVDRIK